METCLPSFVHEDWTNTQACLKHQPGTVHISQVSQQTETDREFPIHDSFIQPNVFTEHLPVSKVATLDVFNSLTRQTMSPPQGLRIREKEYCF